jgi:DNA-binding HxlR family transcriptional regulator
MSPPVLITRMKELREATLVELAEGGYQLTPAGCELIRQLKPLSRWAESWGRQFS